ncbi:sensor histidine kinase [Hippea maritima]|uniref:histidine kinase n=1 Tax=Hippea maritima (strain ATCC 700847 / DSM 10411 / MH2) TaxID=760142 RepID=F2LTK1_HIPMA|nr:PAS domain-containing sensor histidine kinase [Hippea maritima]AEA33326.1 histidine kinase [Hippea maritima DSM 10411]
MTSLTLEFLNKLNDSIIIFNENGVVADLNKSAKDKFGLEVSTDVRSILKDDDKKIFFENILSLAKKDKGYSNFMRFLNKDGDLIFCWLNVFKYNDYYVFEIFDLTPMERRASAIGDSAYAKVLKYMSQGIAHSIRNPIMSAGGMLSRIKAKLSQQEDDKLINYIEIVEKSLFRIISIIANIEVVSNSFPVSLEKIDLLELVKELSLKYQDKGVEVAGDSKTGVFVYTNRMHLGFIIDEIIKNAIDATQTVEKPKIEIKVFKKGKNAFIEVKDNGKGIEENELPLTTIPFYSTKPSNMGIGLSLAKFLIEGYHGGVND